MSKPSKYIGDAAFKRFLERYHCPTEFHEFRMRFLGEIASPKGAPQPAEAIEDLFEGEPPEFKGLDEAQEFFDTVLSLWNQMAQGQGRKIKLTPFGKPKTVNEVRDLLIRRIDEIKYGFLDGFWGDEETLSGPAEIGDAVKALEGYAEQFDNLVAELGRRGAPDEDRLRQIIADVRKADREVEQMLTVVVSGMVEVRRRGL